MITTPEVKKIYASLQKQLFYLIPEKWDRIYLYASVIEQMLNLETGELFFYYFPKGILKKNSVNVYEIPNKFNLNEEEYIKLVEKLYLTIKELRNIYKENSEKLWSNITIKLEGLKFQIDFNYENLTYSNYSSEERHIIWKYENLGIPLESFSKKNRNLIQKYINEKVIDLNQVETYIESIYKRPIKNKIEYNREKIEQIDIENDEKNIKEKHEEPKYTYTYVKRKNKRTIKKYEKQVDDKELTYIEQVESQRNAVKSQILNHL